MTARLEGYVRLALGTGGFAMLVFLNVTGNPPGPASTALWLAFILACVGLAYAIPLLTGGSVEVQNSGGSDDEQ